MHKVFVCFLSSLSLSPSNVFLSLNEWLVLSWHASLLLLVVCELGNHFSYFTIRLFLPSSLLLSSLFLPFSTCLSVCAVYSQLQQELNYRYLQDQSGGGPGSVRSGDLSVGGPGSVWSENRGFSVPHSQPSNLHQQVTSLSHTHTHTCDYTVSYNMLRNRTQALVGVASLGMDQSESRRPHQVKWCSAHVTIAKQILAHQQQAKVFLPLVVIPLISGECVID